jgi:hypothetical protein
MTEEAQTTAAGLPASSPGDPPMSLSAGVHAVFDVSRALKLLSIKYNEDVFRQVRDVRKRMAGKEAAVDRH